MNDDPNEVAFAIERAHLPKITRHADEETAQTQMGPQSFVGYRRGLEIPSQLCSGLGVAPPDQVRELIHSPVLTTLQCVELQHYQ